jgi:hypothetical protein
VRHTLGGVGGGSWAGDAELRAGTGGGDRNPEVPVWSADFRLLVHNDFRCNSLSSHLEAKFGRNRLWIVNAATPNAATGVLQHGPEARIGW